MKLADIPPFRFGLVAGEFMETARLHRAKKQPKLAEALEQCVAQIYAIRCQDGEQLMESMQTLLDAWSAGAKQAKAAKDDDLEIIFLVSIERLGEILANEPGTEPTITFRAAGRKD